MSSFDEAYPSIIKWETMQFTNKPNDKGGPTKGGITLKRLMEWRGRDCNAVDVELLTEEEIHDIYKHDWNAIRLSEINSQRLAEALYHCQTMSGSGEAIVLLQRAINSIVPGRVGEDRILGSGTIAVCNLLNEEDLIKAYHDKRIWLIDQIVTNNPSQKEFENGWINRIEATT